MGIDTVVAGARRFLGPLAAPATNAWRLGTYYSFLRRVRNARDRAPKAAAPGPRRVTMLVVSDLSRDPRVERAARTLAARGYHVTVCCPPWTLHEEDLRIDWGTGIELRIVRGSRTHRFPFLADEALLRAAVESRPWAIHCHDLTTCLSGLVAAAETGAHCICDFHEWFSENVVWDARRGRYAAPPRTVRRLRVEMERVVMANATEVVTVCDSIARELERRHPVDRTVRVIRNIPVFQDASGPVRDLRAAAGAGPETFVVLYQGGVGPGRFLEPVIRAMAGVENAILVIRGPSIERFEPGYLELARASGAEGRVVCLPPVPSEQVVAASAGADAGLYTVEDACLNFHYALPNKVFEYLAANLPLLVADYPEVRRIVDRFGVGVCFQADSPDSIRRAILRLQLGRELRRQCRENIPSAVGAMNPEREWAILASIYDGLAA